MFYSNQQGASQSKWLLLCSCVTMFLLIISPSCTVQNAPNSKIEDTSGSPEVARPISTQSSANIISNSDNGVYIQLDAPAEIFSISNSHHTTPEDVLREAGYQGDAGGAASCEGHKDFPFEGPFIMEAPSVLEWREWWHVLSCGWSPGEKVNFILEDSNGEIFFSKIDEATVFGAVGPDFCIPETNGSVAAPCFPDLNTPVGEYKITLAGDTAKLEQVLHISPPTVARLYYYQGKLILYNFQPNEHIRLLSYENHKLESWTEFQVNHNGQLVIENHKNGAFDRSFVVIGDVSGEVSIYPDFLMNIVNVLSPYKNVAIYNPTDDELRNAANLWNIVGYRDLKKPGSETYKVTVQPNDKLRWGFSWCGIDSNTLEEITYPLNIRFYIDNIEVQSIPPFNPQIQIFDDVNSSGWACRRWITLLTNWKPNSRVELEVRYNLHESIFDGRETYPPGEYRQVIYVNVEE